MSGSRVVDYGGRLFGMTPDGRWQGSSGTGRSLLASGTVFDGIVVREFISLQCIAFYFVEITIRRVLIRIRVRLLVGREPVPEILQCPFREPI